MKEYLTSLARDARHASWKLIVFVPLFSGLLAFIGATQGPQYPDSRPFNSFESFFSMIVVPYLPLSLRQMIIPLVLVVLIWLAASDSRRGYRLSRGEVYAMATLAFMWLAYGVMHLAMRQPILEVSNNGFTISLFLLLTVVLALRIALVPLERRILARRHEIKGLSSHEIFK